jgi:DNA (cytosine-5)-methyltransferase 1
MSIRPSVISLFSGAGGSALGYRLGGFKELLGIDIDETACNTFQHNFPLTPAWNRDIRTVEVTEVLQYLELEVGQLDVLDSSPPCVGFSICGRRNIQDKRNDLFLETTRFIEGLRPKVFLIENVPGLMTGKMKGKFNQLFTRLKSTGYKFRCRSINTIYYNVPQSRQRLIFLGVRNDLDTEPVFPQPNSKVKRLKDVLPDVDFHSRGQFDKTIKHSETLPYTITKTPSMFFVQDGIERKPTIDELKILSSFPEDFTFTGSYTQIWNQIGNCVPPLMMKAMGKTIRQEILYK